MEQGNREDNRSDVDCDEGDMMLVMMVMMTSTTAMKMIATTITMIKSAYFLISQNSK